MTRTKEPKSLSCSYESYALDGWEGGIAVCGMDTPNAKVIAIPRLGLSTCLTGHHDSDAVYTMLRKNRTLSEDREQLKLLAGMILSDFG